MVTIYFPLFRKKDLKKAYYETFINFVVTPLTTKPSSHD